MNNDEEEYKEHQIIVLNYKGLKSLPTCLLEEPMCNTIKRLYLKRNLLSSLPRDINKLSHLVDLYLHSNEIETLPDSVGTLQTLESLNVGNNRLKHLPKGICDLVCLKRLCLSNNRLEQLPASIGNLVKLESLEVIRNKLISVPVEICNLTNLENLCLDANKLRVLPRQLYRLKNLKELSVCGNDLIYLPQSIGLVGLHHFYTDNNQHLNSIPHSLLTSDVGINQCGILPPSEDFVLCLRHLKINSTENTPDDVILLPAEIRLVGNCSDRAVETLLELSLRKVYSVTVVLGGQQGTDTTASHVIPKDLSPLLQDPTAYCDNCGREIFLMGYPFVCPLNEGGLHRMFRLGLCCSCNCLKHFFSSNITTKFLYPKLEDLSMALVLA